MKTSKVRLVLVTALAVAWSSSPLAPTQAYGVAPAAAATPANYTPGDPRYYDIGAPTLAELYVSPGGNNANSGTSIGQPLQTLTEAWNRLPMTTTTTGYRINLLPGTYPCEPLPEDINNCINYFSDRHGTYPYPLILRALAGPGTATVRGGLNLNDVDYLYLLDLNLVGGGALPTNSAGNNLLHLENGDHILLRGLSVAGPDCANDTCNNLQEVLKVNQAQYLYVEDSTLGGAWHSTVDYFVVQYGHFVNNRLHTAGQWCMYVKGGTAYLRIEGNELYECQLGFQSGQSANLAVMRSPWFHYETYDIKFINNVLHDIPGVGLSAAGAYNTLFAYNTLYRVGASTDPGYALAEFVHGERNCTPIDEIPNVTLRCPIYTGLGAWGPNFETPSLPAIPNRNVYVYNNIFYNPPLSQTLDSHFNFFGPIPRPAGFQNSPDPANADDNLVIRGNIIWNGPPDHPLGNEDPSQGCQPSNSTCNETQLRAENTINTLEPQLANPDGGDFRPTTNSNLLAATTYPVADFPAWAAFTPLVPAGTLTNTVALDRAGNLRTASSPPGAYVVSGGTVIPGSQKIYLPLVQR